MNLKGAIPLRLRKAKLVHNLTFFGDKPANTYFRMKFNAGPWKAKVGKFTKKKGKVELIFLDAAHYDYPNDIFEEYFKE